MGLFDSVSKSIFGDPKDPQKAAASYYGQAEQAMKQYMQPFVDYGMQAGAYLMPEFQQLLMDPGAKYDQMLSGYEPSKHYQMQQELMGQQAANSAAAGGMRGSPLEQANQQMITQGLLSNDMQRYYGNVSGLYGQGLGGMSNMYNTGYGAASNLSSDLANLYGSQGSMAYRGKMQDQMNQSIFRMMTPLSLFL